MDRKKSKAYNYSCIRQFVLICFSTTLIGPVARSQPQNNQHSSEKPPSPVIINGHERDDLPAIGAITRKKDALEHYSEAIDYQLGQAGVTLDENLLKSEFEAALKRYAPLLNGFARRNGFNALDKNESHCTGTLIKPNIVLTAAHCIYGYRADRLKFIVGPQSATSKDIHDVIGYIWHPKYDHKHWSTWVGADSLEDVAIVVLSERANVPPMRLGSTVFPKNYTGDLELCGYGLSYYNPTTQQGSGSGRKRCAKIPVTAITEKHFKHNVGPNTTIQNVCGGDSGGPALMVAADGEYETVGVTSYEEKGCTVGGSMRVDYYASWIKDALSVVDPASPAAYDKNDYRPKMIQLQPGEFSLVTNYTERADQEQRKSLKIQHKLLVSETEITIGQFQTVMGYNPSKMTAATAEHPVDSVTWSQAIEYCNRLSGKEKLEPCYDIKPGKITWKIDGFKNEFNCAGYRLPTGPEWEFAARAQQDPKYPYPGIEIGKPTTEEISTVSWYNDTTTSRVKDARKPNAWGLYDMSGNVQEWVWDGSLEYKSIRLNPASETIVTLPSNRAVRGGAFNHSRGFVRIAYRNRVATDSHYGNTGFRVVRTIP